MSGPVNADTFDKMVDEDIEWLKSNAPESFVYRDHIVGCLEMAKKYYRQKREAGICHYCKDTELSPSDCPVCRGNGERKGSEE